MSSSTLFTMSLSHCAPLSRSLSILLYHLHFWILAAIYSLLIQSNSVYNWSLHPFRFRSRAFLHNVKHIRHRSVCSCSRERPSYFCALDTYGLLKHQFSRSIQIHGSLSCSLVFFFSFSSIASCCRCGCCYKSDK